mgnify:CR=1 FL=1
MKQARKAEGPSRRRSALDEAELSIVQRLNTRLISVPADKELIREGSIRRISIKNEDGRTMLEVPLTLGLIGAGMQAWDSPNSAEAFGEKLTSFGLEKAIHYRPTGTERFSRFFLSSSDSLFLSGWCSSSAARMVLRRSMAMVIGPTPPGTGVIADAIFETGSYATSPVRR